MITLDQLVCIPEPNVDAAVDFLVKWGAPTARPCVVVAIDPARRDRIQCAALQGVDKLVSWSDRRMGIYFQVNVDRREPTTITTKAGKADIAEARWLHVDIDCYKDGRSRDDVLDQLRAFEPSVINWSGHGVQAFWRLREPVVLDDQMVVEVEARNRWLAAQLGGDSTTDVSRIMRVPGLVNWPDRRKIDMGLGPALAHEISWTDVVHELDAFPALTVRPAHAAEAVDVMIESPDQDAVDALAPRLREILDAGRVEGETLPGDDSGSGWAFHLAVELYRLGWSVGKVAGLLLQSHWLLSKDQSVDVERQAVRTAVRAAARREEAKRMFEDWHDVGEGVIRDG